MAENVEVMATESLLSFDIAIVKSEEKGTTAAHEGDALGMIPEDVTSALKHAIHRTTTASMRSMVAVLRSCMSCRKMMSSDV